MPHQVERCLLTAKEAAAYLGVSLYTLKKIEYAGYFKPYRTPGGHRRYSQRMLDEYLEKSTGFSYKTATPEGKSLDSGQRSEKGGGNMSFLNLAEHKRTEEALWDSHQLLERTLYSLRDAVFILDGATVEIMDCNPAAPEIFGYRRDEMLGRTITFLHVDEAALEEFRGYLHCAIEERGFLHQLEFRMKRKDGTIFPTEHSLMPLEDEQGSRTGWMSVVRDITDRKRAEEEAQKRLREITALHEVSEVINSTLDVNEVFQRVVEELSTTFGYRLVDIYLLEGDGLRLQANVGYDNKTTIELIPLERGVIGRVARTMEPAFVRDVSQDPDYIPAYPEIKSEICVPIMTGKELLGTLNVECDGKRPLTDDDLQLLSTLSSHIGVAIGNARLYEAEQRRSAQRRTIAEVGRKIATILEMDTLLPQVVDLIAQNFAYYRVHIFQIDPDSEYAVYKAGTGKAGLAIAEEGLRLKVGEEGIVGWVAQSGQPLMADDIDKEPRYFFHPALPDTCSELAVAIRLGEKVIGVLDVQSQELNAFDESDLATLETLADQLAVAMENVRLYEEERKRSEELSVLLDTARTLASSLDLEQVLETIARQAKELTEADGSRIYLLEPDEGALKAVVVLEDYAEEIMATPVPVGQGITGHVAATGMPEIVNHAQRDPRAVQIPGTPEEAQCLMCAPLTVKGEVIGVMTLSREGEKEFEEGDLRLLTSLASQAATAMENARLYEETKRLAATDPLTGVWNRRHIEERLRPEVARARRFRHELSVLVMDIDNLKLFNDTHGHPAGDKVIRTVAQVVLTSCREIDIVGRYGGDEFAVLLPEADARGATIVAERILAALEKEPFQAPDGTKLPISISIGAASYPSDSDEAGRLFSLADAAMYSAKVAGGGQFASLTAGPEEVPEELVAPSDVLQGLLIAVDSKDHYTFKHSQEVTARALTLARVVGLSEEEVTALEVAGRLHDVGKIGIPTNVLRKPGPLTPEEWQMIQEHPRLRHMILQQIREMATVLQAVLHHHERYDGNGYPSGLAGENIPLLSRILAVADAFSAMMTDRPYREAFTREEALDELRRNAGKQFDSVLAEKFIELVEKGEIE